MLGDIARARKEARILRIEGQRWLVYELPSTDDRRSSSLVFETENLVRRVRNYPENWRELLDADLLPLMERS